MKDPIVPGAGKPVYLQLYEQLRGDIIAGIYPFGTKAPSKRLLAEELGLSLATVEHAYLLLCEEGYIEPRQRSGYFVSFLPADPFAAAAQQPSPPHAPAAEGGGTGFPFSVLARAMRSVLAEYREAILVKTPSSGCMELRAALSQYLARRRGIQARPEQIVIGSGAEYLYGLIVKMLGRELVFGLEDPGSARIREVYLAEGARCEMLPLGPSGIDSAALAATGASALHITPYRSFPSGVTATASKRHEYLRWAQREGRCLIEDDFESEFSVSGKPEETLFSLCARSGGAEVIYLNTFSRTISPSLRVGYMVLPERLLPLYERAAGFYSCTVPAFEQYVLCELISGGDFERHINRVRRQKRRALAGK
ncbi:MAG: PLP-dependent aminotransferase family protein [Eubacteriales bacterium]|nr:PLP-dependent aminotransferase family protein [Eubacteriales bacterium]